MDRLAAAGVPPEAIARIHAPIGMDIGATSPQEIAVSVLAEVIAALRKPQAVAGQEMTSKGAAA